MPLMMSHMKKRIGRSYTHTHTHTTTHARLMVGHLTSRRNSNSWLGAVGSYPCGFTTCKQCIRHKKSKTVTSFSTGRSHTLWNYINCNSEMVIYVTECSICQLQYIGCTIFNLRVRISKHYNDTSNVHEKNICNVQYLNILERHMEGI